MSIHKLLNTVSVDCIDIFKNNMDICKNIFKKKMFICHFL